MTSNLRIVPKNDWDDAELTPSVTAEVGYEVTNTQNTIRGQVWRTTSNAGQSITAVLPSSRVLSHFSMHRHLCHAGSLRVQLYTDAAATTPASPFSDSGVVSATPYTASEPYTWSEGSNDPLKTLAPYWLWFAETTVRAIKITFSGTPSQNYWQVSRVWAGRYLELFYDPPFGGMLLGQQENTDRERTQGGSLRTNAGEQWRNMTFDLHAMREYELAPWIDIRAYAGTTKDVMVSVYPGDGTRREALYTLAGRLANLNDIGRDVNRLTTRIQVEEN